MTSMVVEGDKNTVESTEVRGDDLGDLITSNGESIRFLHRTTLSSQAMQGVLENGLPAAAGSVISLATKCPVDLEAALRLYDQRHQDDRQVVVIEFPRDEYKEIAQKLKSRGDHTEASCAEDYLLEMEERAGSEKVVVPSRYIRGYIVRETRMFVLNPNFGRDGTAGKRVFQL